jgi:regulation of enolase protein 1 (concanavalin A-like superfamily)
LTRSLALVLALFTLVPAATAQLPPGWGDLDIGSPGAPGSASFSAGTWTIAGSGADIWDTSDQFHFAYHDASDYGSIVARVVSMDYTDPWAKSGVMYRDDLSGGSRFAMVVATPGNGVCFQWRSSSGGSAENSQISGISAPVWVKLARAGASFAGYYSVDGTAWTPLGPETTIPMNSTPKVGLAVTSHNDGVLNTSRFDGVAITNAPPPPPPVFGAYRELWDNICCGLESLTNTDWNPNWPDFPNAAFTKVFNAFEAESNLMDYYGQRMRAFVIPPTNGNYRFWISSDDNSELFVSTSESPANKAYAAAVNTWTNPREWTREPNQQSAPIFLEGGRRYYLEAIMQEGGGGDNLAVRWQLPNGDFEEPIPALVSGAPRLVPFDGVERKPGIYSQSSDVTVLEGQNGFFSVLVTNRAPVSYRWYRDGVPMIGASAQKSLLTVVSPNLATNNGQVYVCVVTNVLGSVTSAPMVLHVLADTVAPTLVRTFNIGVTNVFLVFSEPMDPTSITNTTNYAFTNGMMVSRVVLSADRVTAILTVPALTYGSNYTIRLNNLRDRASTPNLIATNTVAFFQALPYASQNIGSPPFATVITGGGNGYDISASGADIGGTSDQFGFGFQTRTGNFDVAARVAGLSPSDVWAKAGLMARETLEPGSRFAAALATPGMNGSFMEARDPAGATSLRLGSFPANYPETWVRLQRTGDVFNAYASLDGRGWALLGSVPIAMPAQIYFGFSVCSHSGQQPTLASFRDITDITNALLTAVALPGEALGPSSRKTPLAISEIMYKPGARADTNNLEFVELYNSAPWFTDISGYRLFSGDMSFTFPPGTVMPGGSFLVIAASPQSIRNVYGITNVIGPYDGSLKQTGVLQLRDERGSSLLTVSYDSAPPWAAAADGTGHSLVLAKPSYGEGDPRAWAISDALGGSPGQMDAFRPSPLRSVVINEFLAHTDPPFLDFVKLYNHSNEAVDLSGCILTDDWATNRFVLAPGTSIPAKGFLAFDESALHFALDARGETIYLKNPAQTRCLDAIRFGAQENGVSFGRWPDGADQWYRLSAVTRATNNASPRQNEVVINEIMFHPISGDDDDQFVELFNRTGHAVDLGGWELSDGVSFLFPSNTILQANSYLVLARNAAHLRTNYANLNAANCLGDFAGRLSHAGERLALTMPDTIVSTNSHGVISTNLVHIDVSEVTYGTGGRWGQWSDGGGSSLEMIDPNSDPRLASNWRDSNEAGKSTWINIETTGVLDNGANYEAAIQHAQIGLLDSGECLIDDIEIRENGTGPNLVQNSNFESGTNWWWSFQGAYSRSFIDTNGFQGSAKCLHIRASDRLWTGANSCQMELASNDLGEGKTATLRFKARWLCGWPEILMRLNGNWLEATGRLPVPANLGTPGARNSRYVTNAGPAIYAVTHTPTLPAANQTVAVTARVHDSDGLNAMFVYYRIDPTNTYTAIRMTDDGLGGDAIAGDGTFTATIPAQPFGTIAAFYVFARDTRGVTTRFPSSLNDGAPVRECVIRFGDEDPPGSFAVYHLWVTQTNSARWTELSDLSNEYHDCTAVIGSRVFYNLKARFTGSPYHQGFDAPDGNLCHYKWLFADDDKFLGATSFNKIHAPGNGAGDDASLQREQIANTFLRAVGVPWLYRRHVIVYVNGSRRGQLMEDAQTPDSDVVEENFPEDTDGWLYKMQPWFEFGPEPEGIYIPFNNCSWCNLMPYTTTGGVKKTARYRYNFLVRRTPVSASDFTNVFSLVDAASTYGSPDFVANMENLADMENWMRVFAANHAAGNWDSYGSPNSQNLYGYMGTKGTRYSLLMFDFNIVIGNSGSWSPGANLFTGNGQDPNTLRFWQEPTFRRMYWRALGELVSGPLDPSRTMPLANAKYQACVANGVAAEDPNGGIKSWLTQARNNIAAQMAQENTAAFSLDPAVVLSNNFAFLSGQAPFNIKSVQVNGGNYPLTWTSITDFRVAVPLMPGSNYFSVVGVDVKGNPVPGATGAASTIFGGSAGSAVGQVVINEILYHPSRPGAEFVEIFNNSPSLPFDMSGWQLRGLAYTFPPGAVIRPTNYLVLAANGPAFAAVYGATRPVFDTFNGGLQDGGETLSLVKAGTNAATDLFISRVRYDGTAPWPQIAPDSGVSLQLIDPRQDDWRVGNWSSASATPGQQNLPFAAQASFPSLWINEVQAENLTGPTNRAGQRTPWLELYNPSTNSVVLEGLYLSDNYTNLTQWSFPPGALLLPGKFKLVFADGQVQLSDTNELHTSFSLPIGAGKIALTRLATNGTPQVLDYLAYTNLGPNRSYGSMPDGQRFTRQEMVFPTPGATNNGSSASLTVVINEWMAANTNTIVDPVTGKFEDWFELHNYGDSPADLAGFYLTHSSTNAFEFKIPAGYVIPAHGFLLVWADKKNTNTTPDLHVNFKLNKGGASIGLYGSDGRPVDYVTFGPQTENVSMGRYPDGSGQIQSMEIASPRTNNVYNTPPEIAPIPDQLMVLGTTLDFVVPATDIDAPPQLLTYSLDAGAPPGATLNAQTGEFIWTPSIAPSTNTITIMVSDNGNPNRTVSRTFQVSVFNTPPLTGGVNADGQHFSISWPSAPGQNYQVEYKDDLGWVSWLPLGQPIPGTGGAIEFTDNMTGSIDRYYRIRVIR